MTERAYAKGDYTERNALIKSEMSRPGMYFSDKMKFEDVIVHVYDGVEKHRDKVYHIKVTFRLANFSAHRLDT